VLDLRALCLGRTFFSSLFNLLVVIGIRYIPRAIDLFYLGSFKMDKNLRIVIVGAGNPPSSNGRRLG